MRAQPDPFETSAKLQLSEIAVDLEFGFAGGETIMARQLTMYVAHTSFGVKQIHLARIYGRHHSTVGHALTVTEDLRSDPVFDAKLLRVETFLEKAPGLEAAYEG